MGNGIEAHAPSGCFSSPPSTTPPPGIAVIATATAGAEPNRVRTRPPSPKRESSVPLRKRASAKRELQSGSNVPAATRTPPPA